MQIELKNSSYQPMELAKMLGVTSQMMARWLDQYETYTGVVFPRPRANRGRTISRKDAVNVVRAAEITQAHKQKSLTYGLTVLFTGSEYSPQTSKQNTLLATLIQRIDALEQKIDQQNTLLESLQKTLKNPTKGQNKPYKKTT